MSNNSVSAVYGGDEISALVIDTGSSWTRIGFAGEDAPKCVIPTYYAKNKDDTITVGDNEIFKIQPDVDIYSPMSDGEITDIEEVVKIWDYGLSNRLQTDPKEHPILFTEPVWNSQSNREKLTEIALETMETPAFYIAKDSVATAFASGKAIALVVDVGSSVVSTCPVYDGIALKKGSLRTSFAGDFLSKNVNDFLQKEHSSFPLYYEVSKKTSVEPRKPSKAILKDIPKIKPSLKEFQRERVVKEFKESVCQVLEIPYSNEAVLAGNFQSRPFEFPDGYNFIIGNERFKMTECLFNPLLVKNQYPSLVSDDSIGVSKLILNSIMACDVDARAHLTNNIVVTGGSSLLQGFSNRINNDLSQALPGMKIRIHAPGNFIERTCSSWIGGSILASLGTFHQLWISKKEYEEVGPNIVEKRCK